VTGALSALLLVLAAGLGSAAAADGPGTPAPASEAVFSHPADAGVLAGLLGTQALAVAATAGVRGHFEQDRYLAELPKPLRSQGDFLFARGIGVWWHTRTPFDSEFVLTGERAQSRDEGGVALELRAAEQPGVAAAARIFLALFALDFKQLGDDFQLFAMPVAGSGGGRWQLGLRPRMPALAAFFREALVDGGDYASRIELRDAGGDRTEIRLLDAAAIRGDLSAAERSHFAPSVR
jgi:hypothetical protein